MDKTKFASLPLPLVETLIEGLPFHKFYPFLSRLSSYAKEVFLRKHQPLPFLFVGQRVFQCKDGEIIQNSIGDFETCAIVELYENGRAAKIVDSANDVLLVDGRNLVPDDRNVETVLELYKFLYVQTIDGELEIVENEYRVRSMKPNAFRTDYCGRIANGRYIDNPGLDDITIRFYNKESAESWRRKLLDIKPGDSIASKTKVKTKVVHISPNKSSMDKLPYWAKRPNDNPLTCYSVSKTIPLDDIINIYPLKSTTYYESNGIIYQPGMFVILLMDGYPIFRISNVNAYGYRIKYRGVKLYIHEHPHAMVFNTREEAMEWKYKKYIEMEKKQSKLRPGDMVLLWSNSQVQKNKYQMVRTLDAGGEYSPMVVDDTEFENKELENVMMYNDLKRVFLSDWTEVSRINIRDIVFARDLHSTTISNKHIEIGWWVDIVIKRQRYKRVKIQRIISHGIVFDDKFYPLDNLSVTHVYLDNPPKRKDLNSPVNTKLKKQKMLQ